MKTTFNSVADLMKSIEVGQPVYIENFQCADRSRVTTVLKKYSYCFTVRGMDKQGKETESWILNGADYRKHIGININNDYERVEFFWKKDNSPYMTLYFNSEIIKGKAA